MAVGSLLLICVEAGSFGNSVKNAYYLILLILNYKSLYQNFIRIEIVFPALHEVTFALAFRSQFQILWISFIALVNCITHMFSFNWVCSLVTHRRVTWSHFRYTCCTFISCWLNIFFSKCQTQTSVVVMGWSTYSFFSLCKKRFFIWKPKVGDLGGNSQYIIFASPLYKV